MVEYQEECTNYKCKKIIPSKEAKWIGYPFCKECADTIMEEFKKEFGDSED